MTSLRRDSTRVQNGWTDGSRPTAPLPAPPFLIYARRYLCQRIYILIFIIRNIIARAFIALVEKPRTARFAIQLTRGSLARSFSPPFFLSRLRPSTVRGSLSATAIASSTTAPPFLRVFYRLHQKSPLPLSRTCFVEEAPIEYFSRHRSTFPFFSLANRKRAPKEKEKRKRKRKLLEAFSGKKFLGILVRVPRKRGGGGGQAPCEIIVLSRLVVYH